jgi:hypothetical protein
MVCAYQVFADAEYRAVLFYFFKKLYIKRSRVREEAETATQQVPRDCDRR